MARPREFDPEQTLDKAIEFFWLHGYEGSSIQALLKHIGISRGSMYETFGNKRALYLLALDRYLTTARTSMLQMIEDSDTPLEGIASALTLCAEVHACPMARKGCFVTNTITELAPHDPEIAAYLLEAETSMTTVLRNVLTEAQKQGQIAERHDPQALANFLLNTMKGIQVTSKLPRGPNFARDIVRTTMSLLS